jgi:hypothetical protein
MRQTYFVVPVHRLRPSCSQPRQVCASAGIEYKKSKSLRDVMSIEDLIAVSMAEMVAANQIDKFNVRGNAACADECHRSAKKR